MLTTLDRDAGGLLLVVQLVEVAVEHLVDLVEADAVLRALRAGERCDDRAHVELERVGEDGVFCVLVTPEAVRLRIGLDQLDILVRARGEAHVIERLVVDREEAAGRAVFRRHVGDRRAIGERHRRQAWAEELDEAADHALGAQHLRDGEDEIGGGDALVQLAEQLEADDFGNQHRHGLAEHRGLGLDPADAPTEHAETVDHRRVAVGADQRVGIRDHRAVAVIT